MDIEQRPPTKEDKFREGLEGIVELVERLGPVFHTTTELAQAVRLALTNDGQLRLLLQAATATAPRR